MRVTQPKKAQGEGSDSENGLIIPNIEYTAPAAGVDIGVDVDPGLLTFGIGELGGLGAVSLVGASLAMVDIAPALTARYEEASKQIQVSSTLARTGSVVFNQKGFDLDISAPIDVQREIAEVARLRLRGSFEGALSAQGVLVKLEDVQSLRITPGTKYLALGVEGDYGSVRAGVLGLSGSSTADSTPSSSGGPSGAGCRHTSARARTSASRVSTDTSSTATPSGGWHARPPRSATTQPARSSR